MTSIPTEFHRLDNLLQISHSSASKYLIWSRTQESDETGWSLHICAEKEWYEREWRADELEDEFLKSTGDTSWKSFADRFEKAFKGGELHVSETYGKECSVTIDNKSSIPLTFSLPRTSLTAKNENIRTLLFLLAGDTQTRGCKIGAQDEAQAQERVRLESELAHYKREVDRLSRAMTSQSAMNNVNHSAATGTSKQKSTVKAAIKKRKGASLINPRVKKTVASAMEFEDDEEEDA